MTRSAKYAVRCLLLGIALLRAPMVHGEGAAAAAKPAAPGDPPAPADNSPAVADAGAKGAANGAQRRDPFRPFTLDLRMRADRAIQQTPLQKYELGQLAVVATVWDVNPPRALVEDTTGMGYIVSLGTPIGSGGGVVTGIEPQRVIVEERVLDYYGKEQINRIVMETPKEEGPNQVARERQ